MDTMRRMHLLRRPDSTVANLVKDIASIDPGLALLTISPAGGKIYRAKSAVFAR